MSSVLASGIVLAAGKSKGGSSSVFLFLILGLGILGYYFFLRPRSQRQRQAREELKKAAVGDEIATIGGLVGTIVAEDGDRVTVSTGNGTELVFLRQAIGRRLDPPAPDVPDAPDAGSTYDGAPPGFEGPAGSDAAPTGEDPDKK